MESLGRPCLCREPSLGSSTLRKEADAGERKVGSGSSWQHGGSIGNQDSHLSRDVSSNGTRVPARRKLGPQAALQSLGSGSEELSFPPFAASRTIALYAWFLQVWRKFSLMTVLGQDGILGFIQGSQTKLGPRDCPCVDSGR